MDTVDTAITEPVRRLEVFTGAGRRKPDTEVEEVTLPPIIDKAAYQAPAHTHIAELHKRGVRRRRQARASFMNSIEQTSAILFDLMVT